VLYLVTKGETVNSLADLKGKTIISSGKGTTAQYTVEYLLKANGIDPETDVTIDYKAEHADAATAVASAETAIAVLPQPFVTTVPSLWICPWNGRIPPARSCPWA